MKNQTQYKTVPFEPKSSSEYSKNYEFSQKEIGQQFYLSHDSPSHHHKREEYEQDILNQDDIEQMLLKISQLTNQTLVLGQKLFFYEDLSRRLLIQNNDINNKLKTFQISKQRQQNQQKSISQLKQILKEKQAQIKSAKDEILNIKQEKQKEFLKCQLKVKKLQQQLKFRDNMKVIQGKQNINRNQQLKKLQKRNRQLKKINKFLQHDLRQSSIKILQLQKQIQQSQCFQLASHLSRYVKTPKNSMLSQLNNSYQKKSLLKKTNRVNSMKTYGNDNQLKY